MEQEKRFPKYPDNTLVWDIGPGGYILNGLKELPTGLVFTNKGFIQEVTTDALQTSKDFPVDSYGNRVLMAGEKPLVYIYKPTGRDPDALGVLTRVNPNDSFVAVEIGGDGKMRMHFSDGQKPPAYWEPEAKRVSLIDWLMGERTNSNPLSAWQQLWVMHRQAGGVSEDAYQRLFETLALDTTTPWVNMLRTNPEDARQCWVNWSLVA